MSASNRKVKAKNGVGVKPQPMDVLLGRGKSYRKHPGNVIFQDLIQSCRLRYFESSVTTKRDITLDILRTIQKTGQFIVLKDKLWFPINDETARQKIAHAIQYQIRTVLGKIRENSSPVSDTDEIPANREEPTTNVFRTTDDNGSHGNAPESCYSNQQTVNGLPQHDPDSFRYQLASTMTPNDLWCQQRQIQERHVPHDHHWEGRVPSTSDLNVKHAKLPPQILQNADPTALYARSGYSEYFDQQFFWDHSFNVAGVGSREQQYQSNPYMITDTVDRNKDRNHYNGNVLPLSHHGFDSLSHSVHGIHTQDLNSIDDRKVAPHVNSLDSSGISLWNGSDFDSNCELGNDGGIFTSLPVVRSHYPEHGNNNTTNIIVKEKSLVGETDNSPAETLSPRDSTLKRIANNDTTDRLADLSPPPIFVLPKSSAHERCNVVQGEKSTSSPMDCLVRAASDFSRDDSFGVNDDSKGQQHPQP